MAQTPSAYPAATRASSPDTADTADAVVVGGGTVGGWCAYFLAQAGLDRVVLLESDRLGQGASSRAAGIVRSQGGTRWAVDLGEWSRRFYLTQRDRLGLDSGFTPQGYLLPCFTETDIAAARARLAMQHEAGLDARWVTPGELDALAPTMAPGKTVGGTYFAGDGYITPPRNVLAYAVAAVQAGVDVREGVRFTGVRTTGDRVTHVETSAGTIASDRVVLTGGPKLAAIGALAGIRIPVGGVRHQIAVTEPHDAFDPARTPMVFDVVAGLYWRPEERGLLFGMSNPDEPPGKAREIDEPYLAKMRRRLAELVPATDGLGLRRCWAATIDFTPDHLPILGPAITDDGVLAGVTVAAPGGHGMMWGPGVSRVAADLALTGTTDVTDVTDLGLDRFDADGRSRLPADPIALPFPDAPTA
ncbi:MAG TPA: FAD-binding oxidoreductase [Mycobacteriales bacterium]|nr:FAD-binding oxidoreductase [Mycobacteriales bacterium]